MAGGPQWDQEAEGGEGTDDYRCQGVYGCAFLFSCEQSRDADYRFVYLVTEGCSSYESVSEGEQPAEEEPVVKAKVKAKAKPKVEEAKKVKKEKEDASAAESVPKANKAATTTAKPKRKPIPVRGGIQRLLGK